MITTFPLLFRITLCFIRTAVVQSGNLLHCTPMPASVWLHRSKVGHGDGPLGSGKELHIEKTELTEEFRSRIREAYVEAWGCEHLWIEISPEDADL